MYLCSFPLVAKGCFRERDLFVDVGAIVEGDY